MTARFLRWALLDRRVNIRGTAPDTPHLCALICMLYYVQVYVFKQIFIDLHRLRPILPDAEDAPSFVTP